MSLNNYSILFWTVVHLSVKKNNQVEIPISFYLPLGRVCVFVCVCVCVCARVRVMFHSFTCK